MKFRNYEDLIEYLKQQKIINSVVAEIQQLEAELRGKDCDGYNGMQYKS